MTEQQAVYLIPAFAFIIGIIAGVLLITYLPKINQQTAWFIIESEHEKEIAKLFGNIPIVRVERFPSDPQIFVKFKLTKWLDFENDCAKSYLDEMLKILHKHKLKELYSGVY